MTRVQHVLTVILKNKILEWACQGISCLQLKLQFGVKYLNQRLLSLLPLLIFVDVWYYLCANSIGQKITIAPSLSNLAMLLKHVNIHSFDPFIMLYFSHCYKITN